MKFNWELSLGTVIEIVVFLGAVFSWAKKMGQLETKLNMMFDWFEYTVINDKNSNYHHTQKAHKAHSGD